MSPQVPDFVNARINGAPATEVIGDADWLKNEFTPIIQTRGSLPRSVQKRKIG